MSLLAAIELLKKQIDAISNGVERSIEMLPMVTKQKISAKAKTRLKSSYGTFMDALSTKIDNNVFIVELDKDNWLANAVESGKDGFEMKEGILNGKNAKISKKGYRYASVPMGKDKNTPADQMGTRGQQEYQRIIQHVMQKPKFGNRKLKMAQDGSLVESQEVVSDKIKGLYRVRKHKSAKDFYSGKNKGKFSLVMFRTVSERGSMTGAEWKHPGIKPANIFKDIERDLPMIFETLIDANIEAELKGLK